MTDKIRPARQEAFKAMFDELQEGFAELLVKGWNPADAREVIERELGPAEHTRRAA